jgi:hypothetical protein
MKWAYKVIYYDPDEETYTPEQKVALTGAEFARAVELALGPPAIESDLNALGQDGWELVSVMPGKASQDGRPWMAIFKRPA